MSDNIVANKLLYHLDRVAGDRRPITAEIFLTNYCNNRCAYCRYRHQVGEYLHFDDFERFAQRLLDLGVQGIILTGGGEPTINPDFDRICEWLEKNNVPYGINTNFNILKRIRPSYLKVSLDAVNGEDYSRKRGVKQQTYDRVLENIEVYSRWKREHSASTALGVQIVVSRKDEILPFYEAHKGLDVDYISFRPIESQTGGYYVGEDIEEYKKILHELKAKDNRVVANYKWGMMHDTFERCYANWSVITIDHNGDVLYCCQRPQDIVGNIMDKDILEKKHGYCIDMACCEVPCRLSGANKFLQSIERGGKDIEFI